MEEIKCRKPKPIKFYGLTNIYERYTNRFYKWRSLLPNNGDKIKITWLPDNRGVANSYIGMVGVIENMNNIDGEFTLKCETSMLICHGNFDYIKI